MRRPVAVSLLLTLGLVAPAARAAEPGWNPLQDVAAMGALEAARAQPLPGGEFLVLNHIFNGTTDQYAPYAVQVTDVRPDGSASTQSLGMSPYNGADLATSATGDARAVWPFSDAGVSHVWTAARPPGGQFGAPVDAAPSGVFGTPRVAMNASGDSVVVINTSDRVVAVFIPRNGQPSAPVTVMQTPPWSDTSSAFVAGAWTTLADDGKALVVWLEDTTDMACTTDADGSKTCSSTADHYRLRWAEGTSAGFSAPADVADVAPHPTVSLVADRDGGAALAWRGEDGQSRLALRPPGGSFAARDIDASAQASLAVTPDGQLVVAYPLLGRATVIFGSTRDATLGSAISGENADAVMAAAARSGERLVVWQNYYSTRAVWFAADGTRSPTRDVNCGGSPAPFATLASDGRALALFASFVGSEGRMLAALARPETTPSDPTCTPPAPPGVIVNPQPIVIPYAAYNNRKRKSTALMSPPAADDHTAMPATWSDGASDNPAFSQDNRDARLFAFDSVATNLVPGDRNGHRDVFVVRRAAGGGNLFGRISLASRGPGGRQANGDSTHPSLDGETGAAPHCVAFESTATNLDRRDRSPDVDVYVRDLRRGRTRLVSVGLRSASNPVVDGRCATVTFGARGSVWVAAVSGGRPMRLARGSDPDQQTNGQGAAYVRGGQVWYRSFIVRRRGGHARLARGRERLVSATPSGRPGNGASGHPALDDVGAYVAFDSHATDLCGTVCVNVTGDVNGRIPDVFRRTLSRRAPTKDRMELVSVGQFGASHDPVISAAGENVLFESDAVRVLPDGTRRGGLDPNQRRVFTWEFPRARMTGGTRLIVRQCRWYQCAQASTTHPAMSSRGNYIAFAAQESEFCPPYNTLVIKGGRGGCAQFTDVFAQYVGPSHEGKPLG